MLCAVVYLLLHFRSSFVVSMCNVYPILVTSFIGSASVIDSLDEKSGTLLHGLDRGDKIGIGKSLTTGT